MGGGLQLEVLARFTATHTHDHDGQSVARRYGVRVLSDGVRGGTEVGVDLDAGIVFIDGRNSSSCEAMPWVCPYVWPYCTPSLLPSFPPSLLPSFPPFACPPVLPSLRPSFLTLPTPPHPCRSPPHAFNLLVRGARARRHGAI